jgi:hypothetical protein
VGIEPDHLIKLTVGGLIAGQGFGKADAVPLVEVHGWKEVVGRKWLAGWRGGGVAGWGEASRVAKTILILA